MGTWSFVVASKVLHNHLRLYLSYALYVSWIVGNIIVIDELITQCWIIWNIVYLLEIKVALSNTSFCDHNQTETKYICSLYYLFRHSAVICSLLSQNANAATQNIIFYYCNFSCLCSFLELLILVCLENYILTNHNHSFVFIPS